MIKLIYQEQLEDQFNLLRLLCNMHNDFGIYKNSYKVRLVLKWISNKVRKPIWLGVNGPKPRTPYGVPGNTITDQIDYDIKY